MGLIFFFLKIERCENLIIKARFCLLDEVSIDVIVLFNFHHYPIVCQSILLTNWINIGFRAAPNRPGQLQPFASCKWLIYHLKRKRLEIHMLVWREKGPLRWRPAGTKHVLMTLRQPYCFHTALSHHPGNTHTHGTILPTVPNNSVWSYS